MSLNKMCIIGNVGQDPQVNKTQSGNKIASFSVATTKSYKDKSGTKQTITAWHKIVVYNENLANLVESYVKKGTQLYIEGELTYGKYKNKEGQEVNKTEIVLQGYQSVLQLLGGGDNKNQEEEQPKVKSKTKPKQEDFEEEDDFENAPF